MKRIVAIIFSVLVLTFIASCTDKGAMRERLDYVSQCNRADTVFTEAWLLTVDSLVRYFDDQGNANERMMAHYLKGRVHHDMGEAPIALECYQKATEMADTTSGDCDLYTLYAIYGQMALLFDHQYLPDDEMKALKASEQIAWKDGDTLSAIKAYELRIRPYFLRGDTDSMIIVMKDARDMFLKSGSREKAARAIYSLISISLDRGNTQEARHYLDIYERESGNFNEKGELIKGDHYYYDKGRYLLAMGQIDSAKYCFDKVLGHGLFEAGYKGLLSVYKARHNADSIAKYAELFANANDSNYYYVNQEKIHLISTMYDYSYQRRIAEEKKREAENLILGILFTILVSLLAISALLGVFYSFKAKRLQEISELTLTRDNLEKLLAEKENSVETIKNEITRLNNKNANIHRTHKEEILCLQSQINLLQQKFTEVMEKEKANPSIDAVIHTFKDKFQEYHRGDLPPTNSEWEQFENAFANSHYTYYRFITSHHGMTKEQIRICMMAVLDISESMMAFVLGTDNKRIDRLKRQVNNKLFRDGKASTLKSRLWQYFR